MHVKLKKIYNAELLKLFLSNLFLFNRSRNCADVNECSSNSGKGDCDHFCNNTEGSFQCSCRQGYILQQDGRTCNDLDECVIQNGGCSQKCVNQPGQYSCQCFEGYQNLGNNGTDVICRDIGS